jgi:hypothetical protein
MARLNTKSHEHASAQRNAVLQKEPHCAVDVIAVHIVRFMKVHELVWIRKPHGD